MTTKHPNSVPPQIVYPPGPIECSANTVPRGMLFGGGVYGKPATTPQGGILCGDKFVAPPNLVQGNETREISSHRTFGSLWTTGGVRFWQASSEIKKRRHLQRRWTSSWHSLRGSCLQCVQWVL